MDALWNIINRTSFNASYRIWMVLNEMGRQPWIVRGYMRVAEAATQAGGITFVTILFGILYIILMYTCAYVLIRMFKNKPAYEDVNRLAKKQGGEIENDLCIYRYNSVMVVFILLHHYCFYRFWGRFLRIAFKVNW